MIKADTNTKFIVNKDTPVFVSKGSSMENSGNKAFRGTIVEGIIIEKAMRDPRDPKGIVKARLLQNAKKKTEYLAPEALNLYIDHYSNQDGKSNREKWIGSKVKGSTSPLIKYGIPVLAGYGGYLIAKKRGASMVSTVVFVISAAIIGLLPGYLLSGKKE